VKLSQRRLARPSLGGLMATRQGSLTLALLCAVCAAGILIFALGRYKSNLKTTVQQATALVATGEIHKGTSGSVVASQNLYKSTPVATTQLAAGAITDAAQLAGETAQADILPGQQLVATDFSPIVGVDQTLTPSQRAVAVSIAESPGITDALQAGNHVDVYSMLSPKSGAVLVLLDTNVEVLKPGTPVPVKVGGQTIAGASMVLALDKAKANQVIFAAEQGTLYLSLRPLKASPTAPYAMNLGTLLADNGATSFGPKPNTSTTNGTKP
jgi:pilus assembly protein CpaB